MRYPALASFNIAGLSIRSSYSLQADMISRF